MLSTKNFERVINGKERSQLRFAIGGNFAVSGDGNLYVNNATVSGAITATSGSIGAWSIGSSSADDISLRNSIYALETMPQPESGDTGKDSPILPASTEVLHRWSASSGHKWKLAIGVPVIKDEKTGNITGYSWTDAAFRIRRDGKVYMKNAAIEGTTIINTTGNITLTSATFKLLSANSNTYLKFGAYEGSSNLPKNGDSDGSTYSGYLRIKTGGSTLLSYDKNFGYFEMGLNSIDLSLTNDINTSGIASFYLTKRYSSSSVVKGVAYTASNGIFLQATDVIAINSPYILLRGSKDNSSFYRIIIRKTQPSGSLDDIEEIGFYDGEFNSRSILGNILIQIPGDYNNVPNWTECKVYYKTNPTKLPSE